MISSVLDGWFLCRLRDVCQLFVYRQAVRTRIYRGQCVANTEEQNRTYYKKKKKKQGNPVYVF